MGIKAAAWLILPLALVAIIGAIQKPSEEQLKAEWSTFVKDYDAAYKLWLKPYSDAKTDEERSKVKLDFEKMPAKDFLPRAAAFARKAKGSEYGASAWLWVFSQANQSPVPGLQKEALNALMADYVDSPKLVQLAQNLQYGSADVGKQESEKALKTLLEKSPVEDVKAQSLAALAGLNMPYQGQTEEQKKAAEGYLKRLLADFPNSKAADRAKGAMFELQNLQIGMVAPDFEATDENGKKFKLSDYRGKVVIVDFWGFW